MKTIKLSDIIIPEDRQRKSFDATHLQELAADFQDIGILHPIVLRDDQRTLVVGECRLRAAQICAQLNRPIRHNGNDVPLGHIPYTHLGEMSEVQIYQAELHENTKRRHLSVIEEAKAVARYHALRRAQDPAITDRTIADEISPDMPTSTASQLINNSNLIASHLHLPEVQKAKSTAEAVRAIRRSANADLNSTLGALAMQSYTGSHSHILGDAREILPTLPANTYTCICTDPPYGVGADKFSSQQEQSHDYDDSEDYTFDLLSFCATEFLRVAAEQAHLYLFCDPRHWHILRDIFTTAGWDCWKRPLIWHKAVGPAAGIGILPRPDHGPRNSYDCILFANKGDRRVNHVQQDVISNCPRTSVSGHPAEKPASVYINLLARSCAPGDQVLDAFAGGGPIFPAANQLHLTATGINRSQVDYDTANLRLTEQPMKDLL